MPSPVSDAPAFWATLPSLLWFGLTAVLLLAFRKPLHDLIAQLVDRVRAGAPMKFGSWEIGPVAAAQSQQPAPPVAASECRHPEQFGVESGPTPGSGPVPADAAPLAAERAGYYAATRQIMVVHRLFRSSRPKQDYDVLIYLIPHGEQSLIAVTGVEYFLGRYWNNQVFASHDRSRGFSITVAAWGSFLCTAKVWFNDGTWAVLHRYIDFEMGAAAPTLPAAGAKRE